MAPGAAQRVQTLSLAELARRTIPFEPGDEHDSRSTGTFGPF